MSFVVGEHYNRCGKQKSNKGGNICSTYYFSRFFFFKNKSDVNIMTGIENPQRINFHNQGYTDVTTLKAYI